MAAIALLVPGSRATAQQPAAGDSAAVTAAVERFHHALAAGDSADALALLAEDVLILEAGGTETRSEYQAHHLASDIAFARAVPGQRTVLQVRVRGDVAWVISSSVTQGTYRDRAIDAAGAETMLLTRAGGRWLISGIHWSSRQRRRQP